MPEINYVREKMPNQDAAVRVTNFSEVALGYNPEIAIREAQRCIACKKPFCIKGCPVEIDIPGFIELIKKGDFNAAYAKIKEKNSLPAICGRVCPQESQCEKYCILGKKGEAVGIGRLERFVADFAMRRGEVEMKKTAAPTGRKVAVVGSGPSGLTVAADLCLMGHQVTIFEALHTPGGVLVYGIPEFRLPKDIVRQEIETIAKMGVEIRTNMVIGKIFTLDELLNGSVDAIFVGTGAGLPYFMNIPGENLNGVYSANEFLTRANLMKGYLFPDHLTPIAIGEKVAVIGGGNVAMDAARTALRLGAKESYIIYRRTDKELPARQEEVEHAHEEGVQFRFLTSPVEIIGDEEGWIKGMNCLRYELGDADASGRRSPVAIPGSDFFMPMDTIIMAIGQGPNPLVPETTPDMEINRWGNIVADEVTGRTSRTAVFAGGDIVTGAATVILAMGAGKNAARAIDEYLKSL